MGGNWFSRLIVNFSRNKHPRAGRKEQKPAQGERDREITLYPKTTLKSIKEAEETLDNILVELGVKTEGQEQNCATNNQ